MPISVASPAMKKKMSCQEPSSRINWPMPGATTGNAMKTMKASDITWAMSRPENRSRTTAVATTRCEAAPMLLGFILGPMMEENLRRSMQLSHGDASTFFTSPVSAAMLVAAVALLVVVMLPSLRRRRGEIFEEET